jgi:hypothetical protein
MSDFDVLAQPCFYCGLPADTIDHVVPQSLLQAVRDSGEEGLIAAIDERHRRMTVRACHECNSLAGGKYHQRLDERAEYIRKRLAERYRKALAMPDWADTELMGLSERLRNYVISALLRRDLVLRRPLALAILVTISSPLLLVAVSYSRTGALLAGFALIALAALDWMRP